MITSELGPEISLGRLRKCLGLMVDLAQLCSHRVLIEDDFKLEEYHFKMKLHDKNRLFQDSVPF